MSQKKKLIPPTPNNRFVQLLLAPPDRHGDTYMYALDASGQVWYTDVDYPSWYMQPMEMPKLEKGD